MTNNSYTIVSLFYSVALLIIYFCRPKLKTLENKLYGNLILLNFTNVIAALLCFFTILGRNSYPVLNEFVSKFLLVCFASWVIVFTVYIFVISYNNGKNQRFENQYNKIKTIFMVIFMVTLALIFVLPLNYFGENGIAYSYGPSANVVYVLVTLLIITWVIICLKNYKDLKNKKYLPVLIFIVLIILVVIVQKLNPALLLITAMETFVTVIMYFTIENPDLKMLNDYREAKEYAEDSNIEKQMFIYNMSQDMKQPLLRMSRFCENLLNSDNNLEIKNGIRSLKSECNSMLQNINGIFDIDIKDIRDLSTDNTKYNLQNMLKLVDTNMRKEVEESGKKVEFISVISDTLPKEVIGDSTRLKEVLRIIFDNALKHTSEGYIEFHVSEIHKNHVCRLMITLEDSGVGIAAEKMEELFNKDKIAKKDNVDNKENLALAKKIINILGGNLIVSSQQDVGTKVSIILDQELVDGEVTELDKYGNVYLQDKKVLVLGGSDEEQTYLMRGIAEFGGVMESVESIANVIEKIKNHNKYFAIILDGDLTHRTASEMLVRLKEMKGFNVPVILLTKDKTMKSSKNLAILGFAGAILRPVTEKDIMQILKKIDDKKNEK